MKKLFVLFTMSIISACAISGEKYEIAFAGSQPIVAFATDGPFNEGVVETQSSDWGKGHGGGKLRLLQDRKGAGDKVFGRVTWIDRDSAIMVSSPFEASLSAGKKYDFVPAGHKKPIVTVTRVQ